MEGDEGGGMRMKKKKVTSGEVDYKTKAGTAWSHSFLNQKPWHPLSYPNQRRKWIAEQTHAERERRTEEVSREYAQEQDFFRQTALISQKEKEKVEMMQAVSFMYVKPPGYNAESAKEAALADERKNQEFPPASSMPPPESAPNKIEEKKKRRPKDVYGRALPTEEEFDVLKNAPKLETGVVGRAKPFGVEVRNVRCLRCGNYGHQSGDRECPLKDAIMPNEENRLKRDDPLTAILAHVDPTEPLKWELKQKPGISPPRGGFDMDDPNQQIVAEDDIFDEYGGFLYGGEIPALLTSFSSKTVKKSKKTKKHRKHSHSRKKESSSYDEDKLSSSSNDERRSKKEKKRKDEKETRRHHYKDLDQHHSYSAGRHESEKNRDKDSYSKDYRSSNKRRHSHVGTERSRDRHVHR